MTVIIDRRNEPSNDKFGTDRQRFRQRYRDVIKKVVSDEAGRRGITDFEGGISVPIPKDSLKEPVIHHRESGTSQRVFPGNLRYDVGDRIPKPQGGGGGGGGSQASDDGEGEDDFIWVSPEEYLEILFEGRKLPDMTKLRGEDAKTVDLEHAGYTTKGPSHKMDADRTNKKRLGEAIPISKMAERRMVQNLAEQYNILAGYGKDIAPLDLSKVGKQERLGVALEATRSLREIFSVEAPAGEGDASLVQVLTEGVQILNENLRARVDNEDDQKRLSVLEKRLPEQMKAKDQAADFRNHHLTYKYDDEVPQPIAKAVMFCMMDVSASMDQERKNTAKSFFWLVYHFLKSKYEEVDIAFIAHTTDAKEVDEETFFYGRETGGTRVSSCLEKTKEIIAKRYPVSEWNLYGVQASDGDNWHDDNQRVISLLGELLPDFQAYYYTEVDEEPSWGRGDNLLPVYEQLAEQFPNLFTARIETPAHAIDVFKSFFPKNGQQPQVAQPNGPA